MVSSQHVPTLWPEEKYGSPSTSYSTAGDGLVLLSILQLWVGAVNCEAIRLQNYSHVGPLPRLTAALIAKTAPCARVENSASSARLSGGEALLEHSQRWDLGNLT